MMQSIETARKGISYRSRTEARWAVFFDTLGIQHKYETQAYRLAQDLWYLPDFFLPEYRHWIEVKGNPPTIEEKRKARLLAYRTSYPVNILFQGIPNPKRDDWHSHVEVYRSDINILSLLILRCVAKDVQDAFSAARRVQFVG